MMRTAQVGGVVLLAVVFAACGWVGSAAEAPRATAVPPRANPTATWVRPVATRRRPTATLPPTPIVNTVVVAVVQVDSLRTRAYSGTEYAILFSNRRADVLYVAGDAGGPDRAWLPIYAVGKGYGWVAERYVQLEERPATGNDYAIWLQHIHQMPMDWAQPPPAVPTPTPPTLAATVEPAPVVQAPEVPASVPAAETITRSYRWQFNGEWNWEIAIPRALYDEYRHLPRAHTRNYSIYATHPSDDVYIGELVDDIREAALKAGYSDDETVEFAAAFVQSLPYTVDSVTTAYDEYPRYPIETLVDNGGDCEDTSILLAAIVDNLGYGVALINPPAHMAVGVAGADGLTGRYWNYQGTKYYYLETTDESWQIGEVPQEYSRANANVYPVVAVAILTHDWVATRRGDQLVVDISVRNEGAAGSTGASVSAGFESDGLIYNQADSGVFSMAAGTEVNVKLKVSVPRDRHIRLLVYVSDGNVVVDESNGDWFDSR